MSTLKRLIEHPAAERAILALVVLNAIALGLETSPSVMERFGPALLLLDQAILAVFVAELALRLAVHRLAFFRDPWAVFDLTIVAIALVPATGPFQVVRALRVLRAFRLITRIPSLRRVVGALVGALPGMSSIVLLLALVLYVFAVMATQLFGADMPDRFGTLGLSLLTLFQLVTLDGWSGEVVRPLMETHPYSWIFFILFILVSSFTVFNLFIGVVVNAMQAEHEAERVEKTGRPPASLEEVLAEVRTLRAEVATLKAASRD